MPINDKGEFIRSQPSPTSPSVSCHRERKQLITLENMLIVSMVIGLAVMLAGVIWVVIQCWEWVLLAVIGTAIAQLRRWLG
jgi:vacuolar-type H+-ATPase subunit I/STV1